jgi:Mrp family chromosome partitioning ATPase
MITSSLPGEGKTFTSVNLALSLARERDVSVLLIDCDIPKPHISHILGAGSDLGLMDVLVDESRDIESLIVATSTKGLSFLPAGVSSEGSAELLISNRMRQVLAQVLAEDPRRIVLLDSPPLLVTSEGRALTKMAGQIVMVVRSGKTPTHALQDAVKLFEPHQMGGIVLNDGRLTLTEGFYGYGYYGDQSDAKS